MGIGGALKSAGSNAWNHPRVQNVRSNVKGRAQDAWNRPNVMSIPHSGKVIGTAGLMGGVALATLKGGHGAIKATGRAIGGQFREKSIFILIFPIFLIIIDYALKLNGISLDFLWDNPGLFVDAIERIVIQGPYWVFLVLFVIIRKPSKKEDILFYAFLIFISLFTLNFGGSNIWIFIHLLFAMATFVFLLHGLDKNCEITQEHWIFVFIMIFDIFGIATLTGLNSMLGNAIPELFLNRIIFPFWLFYYLSFVKESTAKTAVNVMIVLIYAGYFGVQWIQTGAVDVQEMGTQAEEGGVFFGNVVGGWAGFVSSWFSNQIQYAITGKVEDNEYEPLGVYLENVESADPKYYLDENVIVWGSVKARTLDDPIKIKVGCYIKDEECVNEEDEERDGRCYADVAQPGPDDVFPVFTLEENDFVCTFNGCIPQDTDESGRPIFYEGALDEPDMCPTYRLKVGSNTVTTYADFNFETLSYQKVYFIDKERQRAMSREEMDIYEEFDIDDKNPVSVYTNGPAKLEMGSSSTLIGVSESYNVKPSIGISIQNREGWEGRIQQLTELVLFMPYGTYIDKPATDCSSDFVVYNRINCITSCENPKCEDTCNSLFDDGLEGDVNAYRLDIDELIRREPEEDYEKAREFRCRYNTTPSEVLGNSPFATKYFKAKAEYDYHLEKKVTVNVRDVERVEREEEIVE
ncbi:rod shape-determining protein MreD [bacterium]|nr:rod shape-determining protein MreD [bacterium]